MKRIKAQKAYLVFMFILAVFMVLPGCSGGEAGGGRWDKPMSNPVTTANPVKVLSTIPVNGATGVFTNTKIISATFSAPMDPSTITTSTFTLKQGTTDVSGTVTYTGVTAVFKPVNTLLSNTKYTATITSGSRDLTGNALASDYVWSFTTGADIGPVIEINLGLATPFGVAATAGVTNTNTAPLTTINGNVVLDPVSGATCNGVAVNGTGGFGLCGSTTPTSTPTLVGSVYSAYFVPAGGPSPTAIVTDLKAAYLSITPPSGPPAAGSLGGATNLPAGTTLGESTGSANVLNDNYFTPGVYQSLTSILITGDLILDGQGDPNAIFIFQSSSTVGTADGAVSPGIRTRILLINGAKASNVWWQAGTSATLGLYSEFQGNILASADITMKTGATSCGRLLAGAFTSGAFVFDANVVSVPGKPFAPPAGYSQVCQ